METIQGIVTDITFRNEENGFTVLNLRNRDPRPRCSASARCPRWSRGRRSRPRASSGSTRGSGAVLGLVLRDRATAHSGGNRRAPRERPHREHRRGASKNIIDVFGLKTLDILDNEPARLLEVRGIGKKTLEKIVEAWQRKRRIRGVHGVSAGMRDHVGCSTLAATWGRCPWHKDPKGKLTTLGGGMSRKDAILNMRQILMKRRDALRKALAGDLSLLKELRAQTSGDMVDAALDSVQDEISSQLAEVESRELARIEYALERMRDGQFGICEGCGTASPWRG